MCQTHRDQHVRAFSAREVQAEPLVTAIPCLFKQHQHRFAFDKLDAEAGVPRQAVRRVAGDDDMVDLGRQFLQAGGRASA